MKKQVNAVRMSGFMLGVLAMLAVVLMLVLPGCQKEDLPIDDPTLKSAALPELTLTYNDEVFAGEDFTIGFASTCGKLMIERGYINGAPILEGGLVVGHEKIYAGLDCSTGLLQWEPIGGDELLPCTGGTITENWPEIGTYVYRVKLNQKAAKNSVCSDCADFKGNKTECFIVTVVESGSGVFTDIRDNREYKWVKIGNQIWMAENLAYKTETGSWAYDNDESYVAVYGRLYDWPTTMNGSESSVLNPSGVRGICPEGWHLPSDAEWIELEMTLGMSEQDAVNTWGTRGTDQGAQLKSTSVWPPESTGTNSSGFSALPGGTRNGSGDFAGWFVSLGNSGLWWSSTEANPEGAMDRSLHTYFTNQVSRNSYPKENAISVRCVKN